MGEATVLCRSDELASGEARRFDIGQYRIALVRLGDDFYALGDRCSESSPSGSQGKRGQEIVLDSAGGSSASSHDAESNAVGRS